MHSVNVALQEIRRNELSISASVTVTLRVRTTRQARQTTRSAASTARSTAAARTREGVAECRSPLPSSHDPAMVSTNLQDETRSPDTFDPQGTRASGDGWTELIVRTSQVCESLNTACVQQSSTWQSCKHRGDCGRCNRKGGSFEVEAMPPMLGTHDRCAASFSSICGRFKIRSGEQCAR